MDKITKEQINLIRKASTLRFEGGIGYAHLLVGMEQSTSYVDSIGIGMQRVGGKSNPFLIYEESPTNIATLARLLFVGCSLRFVIDQTPSYCDRFYGVEVLDGNVVKYQLRLG